MMQIALIGIGSGAASALLLASVASGSALSILLSSLASLPILIAAIGWRHPAGLVGLLTGSLGLAVALSPLDALAFALGVALPAWWLAYLALLARPRPDGAPEWYPIGRLVLWIVVMATVLAVVVMPMLAGGPSDYQAGARRMLEQGLRAFLGTPADKPLELPNVADTGRFIDLVVTLLLPVVVATSWTVTTLVNLWLAGRIVHRSGRLARPWPDIAVELAFPRGTAAALGIAAVVGWFASGSVGLFSEVLTLTLLVAFALLGLALLHVVTRGLAVRPILLVATYVFVFPQTWPLFALVGLAEQLFGIRARFLARRRSPSPPLDPSH